MLAAWESGDGPNRVHLHASGVTGIPAIHAAALESELFASLKLSEDVVPWSAVVRDPTQGKMAEVNPSFNRRANGPRAR